MAFGIFAPIASAQETMLLGTPTVSSACTAQIDARLLQQQRIARDVLFGRDAADNEELGTTRYTEDGTPWLKTAPNTWRSAVRRWETTTLSDAQMDGRTEWEGMNDVRPSPRIPRLGIMAATGRLTSQLVEPITQSYRALQCRMRMVCQSVRATLQGESPQTDGRLRIQVLGCDELRAEPLDRCVFSNESSDAIGQTLTPQAIDALSDTIVRTECEPLMREMLLREAEVLRFTVRYDAAYRSLLQFAGSFDLLIDKFRGDLLTPLEGALSVLGYLTRIPCFLSACNG